MFCIVLFVTFAYADEASYSVNKAKTEGFEESVSITTAGNGAKASINEDSTFVKSGSKSLKITISSTKNAGGKVKYLFKDVFKTENIGKKYMVRGYVYINDAVSATTYSVSFGAIESNNSIRSHISTTKSITSGMWTPMHMSFEVTQEDVDAKLDTLRICMSENGTYNASPKEIYIDDITIYESSETKTVTQKGYTQYAFVDFEEEGLSLPSYSSKTANDFAYKFGGNTISGVTKALIENSGSHSLNKALHFRGRKENNTRIKFSGILPKLDASYLGKQMRVSAYVYSDAVNEEYTDSVYIALMEDNVTTMHYSSITPLKEGTFTYAELELIITQEVLDKFATYPARIAFQTVMSKSTNLYIDDIKVEFMERGITPNAYFADETVFQKGKPLKVWGSGIVDGEEVSVKLQNETKTTTVKDGKWMVEFSPINSYAKNVDFEIKGRIYKNVAIGEVWFLSGQSNMQKPMTQMYDKDEVIADSANYDIRLLTQNSLRSTTEELYDGDSKWLTTKKDGDAVKMSATGLFTAYHLAKEMPDVTIGLINVAVGGTIIESWLSEESLYSRDEYKLYQSRLEKHNAGTETLSDIPTQHYKSVYAPMKNISAKGLLWYHGESNSHYSDTLEYNQTYKYDLKLEDLISQYRRDQNDENFPVITFMLAPFASEYYDFTINRQHTLDVVKRLDNVYIVSTSNEGPQQAEYDDNDTIHPRNKKPVGERAARAILYNVYGKNDYEVWNAPIYKSMNVEGNKAILTFDLVGDGITTTDGEALKGFEISSDGINFASATAVVNGNNVEVYADGIENPVEVRYCYVKISSDNETLGGNMTNETNIPAIPFRASVILLDAENKTVDNTATYTVTNNGYNEMDLDLIFALYDEYNNLKEAKVKSVFLPTVGDYDVNYEFEKTVEDTDIVKVFAFDDVLTLIPVLKSK